MKKNVARIVFVTGPNGAGKEWVCENILPIAGVSHRVIGVSAMLKSVNLPIAEIRKMENGGLVSNEYIESLIDSTARDYFRNYPPENLLGFDGFPRNVEQARYIQENFDPLTTSILHVDANKETCYSAMLKRIASGKGRPDDNDETFEERWKLYEEKVLPAIRILGEDYRVFVVYGGVGIPEEMKLAPILRMFTKMGFKLNCDDHPTVKEICEDVKACSHTTLYRFARAHPKIKKECPSVWLRGKKAS